ncbi:MAG: ferredoxin family protein [Chloroflexi bacterium]|nr:ferredoxin family protein [Chloroflexota bacterium]
MVAKIEKSVCNGCGLCIYACGEFCLDFDAVRYKAHLAKPRDCIDCRHCAYACPRHAITFVIADVERFLRREGRKKEARQN